MKQKILFVCLGNICRSPAAEAVFRYMIRNEGAQALFEIDSAGTYGGHAGSLPDPRMIKAGAHRGYELTHRARRIERADLERFDMVVVMDDSNFHNVRNLASDLESLKKIRRMAEFCTAHNVDHVPDPYYEGAEGFEFVLDILEDGCRGLIRHLGG